MESYRPKDANATSDMPLRQAIDGRFICCPICGCEFTHIERVEVHQDHLLTTVHRDRETLDPDAPSSGRGSAVAVYFWCESGCRFAMRLAFHKGTVSARVTHEGTSHPAELIMQELWRD